MNRLRTLLVVFAVLALATAAEAQNYGCPPGSACYQGGYSTSVPPQVRTYVAPAGSQPAVRSGGSSTAWVTSAPLPSPPPPDPPAKVRRPLKDDVQRQQAEINQLKATKADAGAVLPIPLPGPGTIADDEREAIFKSLDATNQTVVNLDQRLQAVETWQPLWQRLDEAEKKFMSFDPAKFKTDFARELQGSNQPAYDEAKKALTEATRATEKVEGIAGKLGETATKAAEGVLSEKLEDAGFLKRMFGRIKDEGLIPGKQLPTWLSGVLLGHGGLTLVVLGALIWLVADIRAYKKSGGEDKLTIQKLAPALQTLAERTPGQGLELLAREMQRLSDRIDTRLGPSPQPPAGT